jgi:hypothetical protein
MPNLKVDLKTERIFWFYGQTISVEKKTTAVHSGKMTHYIPESNVYLL